MTAARLAVLLLIALGASPAHGQLIPPGMPIPRGTKPPVVFLNGYQRDCSSATFANTFGLADQVLAANGQVSVFFNNCTVSGKQPIEILGAAFGQFLAALKYNDGQPVTTVDVVAHSMGGLILRSYLAGKQVAAGAFQPPASVPIRKAVFLATPHFGSGLPLNPLVSAFANDAQTQELTSGSRFLFDLATWNQGTDDLRGVDAIAVIGDGGLGFTSGNIAFDDGVVALTSASLEWALPGRTRIVPLCHVDGPGLEAAVICGSNPTGIADITSANHLSARIIVSFLNGAAEWQSIGSAPAQDKFLSVDGGIIAMAQNAGGTALAMDSATAVVFGFSKDLNLPTHNVAYTDLFSAGSMGLTAKSGSTTVQRMFTLPAGGAFPFTIRSGPLIAPGGILPAAAKVFPLAVAPGEFVAIYGDALAAQAAQASGPPYPLQLSDAQVLVNGVSAPVQYASPAQINIVMPDVAPGLVKLAVQNGAGTHVVNAMVEPAAPAIFTQNGSGSGPAAALKASNSSLVAADNPLRAGDYVELFLTGLGATTNRGGLEFANQQPVVTIGGKECAVSYAGRAPGYPGLDQINCAVPSGVSDMAAPVVVRSGARSSNVATLAVQ
jgi:uncharacterized protein (TIGR03437 family)